MVVETQHPSAGAVKLIGSPLKLHGTPVVSPKPPPRLGEHTDEILRQYLQLAPEHIEALRKAGAIA
jgi:crotonobetainyl-CoA:carnitine CoA-transferase CaiB-like acyl-CoA transferase